MKESDFVPGVKFKIGNYKSVFEYVVEKTDTSNVDVIKWHDEKRCIRFLNNGFSVFTFFGGIIQMKSTIVPFSSLVKVHDHKPITDEQATTQA